MITLRRVAVFGAVAVLVLATGLVVTIYLDLEGDLVASRQPPPRLVELPPFELTNRDGSTVSLADLRGAPWIADFIFTRCALYCSRLTSRMAMLGSSSAPGGSVVRVSVSVDPTFDTPEVLAAYADSHGVEDPRWLFVTGEAERVRSLVLEGFKLVFEDADPILHTNRFVLVDAEGTVRGYYDATDGTELERLVADLAAIL